MFKGLEHTAIASPDPQKLAEWYVENLAWVINYSYAGNYFVRAPNGSMLEIIPSEGGAPECTMKTPGLRHLAIECANFDQAYAQLQQRGVRMVTEPYSMQGNRLVFFHDGDGNLLHLIERETPLP